MAGLLLDGVHVMDVEVAQTLRERSKGLLGRTGIDTGLVIRPASSVHTFRMRFDIDVAFVRRDGMVTKVVTMRRNRLGAWRPRTRWVLETEAGRMADLGIRPGRTLRVS